MKRFYANNYNKIVLVVWAMFVFLLWLQYIYLSTIIEASLMLIILIPIILSSHILVNIWLPQVMHRKRIKLFTIQFFGTTFFNALFLAMCQQLIRWAGIKGYIPTSTLLAEDNSLLADFLFAVPSVLVINFGFCGLRFFYENIRLQRINLETQLQMLQSQINPHFMFNVLNHIHVLMQTNVELASELLLQYSDMLRFQLYKGKSDRVRLGEEILFLKSFIEIEKLRWKDKVQVDCNWVVTDNNMEIPPLLMFPFIENAFKYASRTIGTQGFVKIELRQEGNGLSLEVRNSKPITGSLKQPEASGIGLNNTRKRLKLLFGENHHLTIKEEENTYYLKLEICRI